MNSERDILLERHTIPQRCSVGCRQPSVGWPRKSPQTIVLLDGLRLRRMFMLASAVLSCTAAIVLAQSPPTISSFSPTSGAVGTSITITGSNFDPTPANNIVWFGAVRGTVTSATPISLTVSVPPGALFAPISVVALNGLAAYSSDRFMPTFRGNGVVDASTFSAEVHFASGPGSYDVKLGDLDGDGKLDVVAVNLDAGTLSDFRNIGSSGNLTAGSLSAKIDLPVPQPLSVSVADLDGDGKLDLVTASSSEAENGKISVFRNVSTSGTLAFEPRVDITTVPYQRTVVVSDVDGDGRPDLAVPSYNAGIVSVYRNLSTPGSLAVSSFAPPVTLAVGGKPYFFAAADLNGDGKPEVITANTDSGIVTVLQNTSAPGAVSFAAKVDFAVGSGAGQYDLAVGDMNNDGKPDLVVANVAPNGGVSIPRNVGLASTINETFFATPASFPTSGGALRLALGDLDGDGKLDVASVQLGSSLSVLRNQSTPGSSSLATQIDYNGLNVANAVAIGDLDGDGKPDLLVPNHGSGTISILRNMEPPPRPIITATSPSYGTVGATITITGSNFDPTPANNVVWFGAVKATVTAATATQLTVTVPAGAMFGPISVSTPSTLVVQSATFFTPTFSGNGGGLDASSFSSRVDFTAGSASYHHVVADIDGDGKPDLLVVNQGSDTLSIFRNISTSGSLTIGSFASKVDFVTADNPSGLAVRDIDGDGKPDIAIANEGAGNVSVFRNLSTVGTIDASSLAARLDFSVGGLPGQVALGDLDGDGKLDMVAANRVSLPARRNLSTIGNIQFDSVVVLDVGSAPNSLAIADLDGDGKPEVISCDNGGSTVTVLRNLASPGSLTTASFALKVSYTVGSHPSGVAVGDLDGDGKPDLAVVNYANGSLSVLRNTSTTGTISSGSFAASVDFNLVGTAASGVALGDLDGDGKLDIATASGTDNVVSIFKNLSAPGSFTTGSLAARIDLATGNYCHSVVIADLDLDGKPDLTTGNYSSGTLSLLRNALVTVQTPVLSWNNPGAIAYSTALGNTHLNATANVPGTFAYNPPAGTVLNAGNSQALSVTFTPTDTIHYTTASAGVTIDVSKASLTATANNAKRLTGAANPSFSGTLSGVVNGDGITASYTTAATTASPAGTYAITPVLSDPNSRLGNYNVTLNNGTLTIIEPHDGVVDPAFDSGNLFAAPNNVLGHGLAVQSDGRFLVMGNNDVANGRLFYRFNADGSLDQGFQVAEPPDFDSSNGKHGLWVQPDDKILYAYRAGPYKILLRRANADGSADSTFASVTLELNTSLLDFANLAIQSDGKMIIVGTFIFLNGAPSHTGIVRLNADGTVDLTFNVGIGITGRGAVVAEDVSSYGRDVVIQPDGKILVAGFFGGFNRIERDGLVRLNPDGSVDRSFRFLANRGLAQNASSRIIRIAL